MLHLQLLIDRPEILREWRPTDRRVLLAAPDAHARQCNRKSTYPFRFSDKTTGKNDDSWKPLENSRRLYFACGKNGCKHLVQANKAFEALLRRLAGRS